MPVDKTLKEIRKDIAFIKNNMATKSELASTTKKFKEYPNVVTKEILQAISDHNDTISSLLDEMELKVVSRREFEALKRKVEQLRPVN